MKRHGDEIEVPGFLRSDAVRSYGRAGRMEEDAWQSIDYYGHAIHTHVRKHLHQTKAQTHQQR